jgi:glycosyltransferase involved in cell wall biosynthesis
MRGQTEGIIYPIDAINIANVVSELRIMENILVTVIIPAFNRPEMLTRAIKSVISQTYQDLEILVIDDGSSIDLSPTISKFDDGRITYHKRSVNLGVSGARIRGIALAKGEYIAFLDSDDEWKPEKTERQLRDLRSKGSDYRVSYTLLDLYYDDTGQVIERQGYSEEGDILDDLVYNELLETPSSWMVETTAIKEVGGFNEKISWGEDWDILLRLAQRCKIALTNERLTIKHEHPGVRLSHDLDGKRGTLDSFLRIYENNLQIFRKYPRARSAILINMAYYQGTLADLSGARRTLIKAIMAYPFWLLPYFSLAINLKKSVNFRG